MRRLLIFGTGAAVIGILLIVVAFYEAYVIVNDLQANLNAAVTTPSTNLLTEASLQAVFLGVMAALGYVLIAKGLDGIRKQELVDIQKGTAARMAQLRPRARPTMPTREARLEAMIRSPPVAEAPPPPPLTPSIPEDTPTYRIPPVYNPPTPDQSLTPQAPYSPEEAVGDQAIVSAEAPPETETEATSNVQGPEAPFQQPSSTPEPQPTPEPASLAGQPVIESAPQATQASSPAPVEIPIAEAEPTAASASSGVEPDRAALTTAEGNRVSWEGGAPEPLNVEVLPESELYGPAAAVEVSGPTPLESAQTSEMSTGPPSSTKKKRGRPRKKPQTA